jgi:hypothetical protein
MGVRPADPRRSWLINEIARSGIQPTGDKSLSELLPDVSRIAKIHEGQRAQQARPRLKSVK